MRTMYFDTGCTPANSPHLFKGQVWRNGTKQIPFDVDAPESATLMFLCSNPNEPEALMPGVIVRKVHSTYLENYYAYLRTGVTGCKSYHLNYGGKNTFYNKDYASIDEIFLVLDLMDPIDLLFHCRLIEILDESGNVLLRYIGEGY